MIDYQDLPRNNILCIDMKSFFASVEAVRLGLDPLKVFLVVVGDKKRKGSVVLAASPLMKKYYGIKTGNRLFEIPCHQKIYIVEARMGDYLKISVQITKLFNTFVPVEAIHQYSIDEAWLCVDGTEKLFGDRWEIARKIQQKIFEQYGLPSCIGIGPNKFLAKVILDIAAKEVGIAECQYEDVQDKLWPQPVEKIWGIGSRMKRNLNSLGIFTLGQLAKYPLKNLKKRFGIMGEQLYYHAHGIDLSPCIKQSVINTSPKSFGHGITLLRDYTGKEVTVVILELAEEVCRRARKAKMCGKTVHLGIGYSKYHGGGGFSRSKSLVNPTNVTLDIYRVCLELFHRYYDGSIVRSVHVTLTNLSSNEIMQLNLFEDYYKKQKLGNVMDMIRSKYGTTAIFRARSLTSAGVIFERSQKIGGHMK